MHGLPSEFDASIFIGCTLDCVTFTENTVHFQFDRRISITLESSYAFHDPRFEGEERSKIPVSQSRLMSLVGRVVQFADVAGQTLRLRFEEGAVLECIDDMPNYESFRIAMGDREIIV